MIDFFRRGSSATGPDLSGLGARLVCAPASLGATVPGGCVGLVFDARGNARRVAAGQRAQGKQGDSVRLFHPGPYAFDVAPCDAAPELGLRFELVVDSPDPRVTQQRFDLFLMSEAPPELRTAMLEESVQAALQRELAQGRLFLPPCTTLDEWHAFRRGVNELVYTRFGMIVDDCVPVDLADTVDFAALLAARAVEPTGQPAVALEWAQRAAQALRLPGDFERDRAAADARALRRLFLELPCVMAGLRLALRHARVPFAVQKALLARLDASALSVETMPAFGLAAPSEPLGAGEMARRSAASLAALEALDQAWALLARLRSAGAQGAPAADDADRIVANLESALAYRRVAKLEEAEGA